MKALLLVALVLVLAVGVLLFVLDSGGGRSRPDTARGPDPTARESGTAVAGDPVPPTPQSTESAAKRQSVEVGASPQAHSIYEGVVIGDGAPVPGASLTILQRDEVLAETTTDERGRFFLESKPPVPGTLRVRSRGFVTIERNLVTRPMGGTEKLGNIRLVRGRRIVGRAIDGQGRGIPDVELRATPLNSGTDILVARAHSGPDGAFEFNDAPLNMALINARAKGFGEREVQYAAGTEPLVIQMQPGADLRLVLHAPRGQPVVGAEVTITSQGEPRGIKRVATSDAEGRVLFEGLGSKVWSVRATHEDYRPAGRSPVEATALEQKLECLPWPGIEGTVRAPNGPPPAGTLVQALPAAAPSDRIGSLLGGKEVDANGAFRLGGLRAGDWRVRAVAPGYAPAVSGIVKLGIDGDGFAGTILLEPGGRLVFAVTLEEEPIADVQLELFRTAPTPAQLWSLSNSPGLSQEQRVVSDLDGLAALENLAPGFVWVGVFADGCPPSTSGPHETTRGAALGPIAIALSRGGRIQGVVRDKAGAPVASTQLRIIESSGSLGFPITLASSEDGRYTSAWLPPGHYKVEAFALSAPNRRSGVSELDLKAGEQRTLDLTL